MFHILLQTTQPDLSHWTPAAIEKLLETVLEIATIVASVLAFSKAHQAEKKGKANEQLITTNAQETNKDVRSLNEQITTVAKDALPPATAQAIVDASKTLKETLDTLHGTDRGANV